MIFKNGDQVKTPFGDPSMNKFKHGTFLWYRGKYAYFHHINTGKTLKRRPDEIFPE